MIHSSVLCNLIRENNVKRFAEIGVWKSHSVKQILRTKDVSLDEYWAVDRWDILGEGYGRMGRVTKEKWDDLYKYCCSLMLYFRQLRVLKLTSEQAASLFPNGYFDFVYIDADHKYEASKKDNRLWIPKVKENGIFGGHDYCIRKSKDHKVKLAVDEMFNSEELHLEADTVWWVRKTKTMDERMEYV